VCVSLNTHRRKCTKCHVKQCTELGLFELLWYKFNRRLYSSNILQILSGQDYNASRAAQGIVDCLVGLRTPNRAATSRREAATNPPTPSSQRNVFTRSKSQGQGPSHGQLSCATKAQRVERRVVCRIVCDSINDEDRHVAPELSQPLIWICNMQCVIG